MSGDSMIGDSMIGEFEYVECACVCVCLGVC